MPNFLSDRDNIKRLAYMLSEGLSNSVIAQELGVSDRSIPRWKKHPEVISALDEILKSKHQTLKETWQQRQERYREQVQEFSDRTLKDLGTIRELSNIYLTHLIKKLDSINHEDIPTKMLPIHLRTCLEVIRVTDELESTRLCVGELMSELDKHNQENEN